MKKKHSWKPVALFPPAAEGFIELNHALILVVPRLRNSVSFRVWPRPGIFAFALSLGSVRRLLGSDLLDKRGHCQPFCGKTGSCPMHGSQKLAPRIVDT